MTQTDPDQQLMLSYQAGDDSAFESLYTRHRGPLYRYLLRHCGEAAIADELFQDVWMKLIHARERYQASARFTTWLYHMAHNRLIDHYRRRTLRPVAGNGDDPDPAESIPDVSGRQPEQRLQQHEQLSRLLELVRQLPDDQREAFLLREEAGLSIGEIAEVTAVAEETAKSRLRYAKAKLRDGLRDWL